MVRHPGQPGHPRLGFVVSKQCGNAVTRNRIKRRLRHAVLNSELQPGNDYVIIANSQVAEATYPTLSKWLEGALAKSHS